MARNGSGIYTLPPVYKAVPNTTILSAQHNGPLEDIQAALTGSVASDGQTPMTGDLQLAFNKIVQLAPGTEPDHAVRLDQISPILNAVGKVFSTVVEASANASLTAGDTIGTLGYEAKYDRGSAFYTVLTLDDFGGTPDGMADHLTVGGLVMKLARGANVVAEQYGALNGEVSANLQAAWDDMAKWQTEHGGSNTAVSFSYAGTGTLKNQFKLNLAGNSITSVTLNMESSRLTAVAGGDLSSTNAMFLVRVSSSEAYFGTLDGGKFAACYDFLSCFALRAYHPYAVHFKGKGIRVRGVSGQSVYYAPRANEYGTNDAEFVQVNFSAIGFSAEGSDYNVFNANITFCAVCVQFQPGALASYFQLGHFVNGNPKSTGGGSGLPFNMPLVVNLSESGNTLVDCYFDNGPVDDYTNTLKIIDCSVVKNAASDFPQPRIREYPQQVGQTIIPDLMIKSLRGSGTVGFVNTGSFTWAGDITVTDDLYTGMAQGNSDTSASKVRYSVYPSNDPVIEIHVKTQGRFAKTYKSGVDILKQIFDPLLNLVTFTSHVGPDTTDDVDLGTTALRWRNVFARRGIVLGAANITITTGNGSPEGVVTADKGAVYLRGDGGAGTCFYVKESGSGNTGWVGK